MLTLYKKVFIMNEGKIHWILYLLSKKKQILLTYFILTRNKTAFYP